jgi:hypothetical protein
MIQDIEDSSDDEELGVIHTNVVNSITALSQTVPQTIKVRKKSIFYGFYKFLFKMTELY